MAVRRHDGSPDPETAPGAAPFERIPMVTSTIGGATVAVDLARVLRIEAEGGADEATAMQSVDLAACWGPVTPATPAGRKALVLAAGGTLVRLLLGEGLRVVSFRSTAIVAVPSFLREWGRRAAVRELIALDEGLGYVLDVERLRELAEQARP